MNDQDYILKAVELADGFTLPDVWNYRLEISRTKAAFSDYEFPEQWFTDTLAAQLVRQVDAQNYALVTDYRATMVSTDANCFTVEGTDRTMNTIKAIVDSKVLEL